jgi:hypothetical protein
MDKDREDRIEKIIKEHEARLGNVERVIKVEEGMIALSKELKETLTTILNKLNKDLAEIGVDIKDIKREGGYERHS